MHAEISVAMGKTCMISEDPGKQVFSLYTQKGVIITLPKVITDQVQHFFDRKSKRKSRAAILDFQLLPRYWSINFLHILF